MSTVVAMAEDKNSKHPTDRFKVLKVLLDSGSDGDLLFLPEGKEPIIPIKKRMASQKWRTSSGTFETKDVGDVELTFPEYSTSKVASFRPDVVWVPRNSGAPVYDLILGVKSLANIGTILNFADSTITIDHVTLPMRANKMETLKEIRAQLKDLLEPKSMREATNRAVEILDANYEKADIPKIVAENCTHLSSQQQSHLIKLLMEFEDLFDGTLGDWKTDPVGLELKEGAKPYHGRAYPVPQVHLGTLKREIKRLCDLGVLKKQPDSPWAAPTFIIPKKHCKRWMALPMLPLCT